MIYFPDNYRKLTNAQLKYLKWKCEKVYTYQAKDEKELEKIYFNLYLIRCEMKARCLDEVRY